MFNPHLHVCLRAPTQSHMHGCVLIVRPCVYEKKKKNTGRMCGSAGGTCRGDGGVTSKLQKKLIKNEKKESRGGRE